MFLDDFPPAFPAALVRLASEFAFFTCSSSSFIFSSSITSNTALTCVLTLSTFSCNEASSAPLKDSKSDGILYSMNRDIKSCVNRTSLLRASSGSPSNTSNCGFICTTQTPITDDSSCMLRKVVANRRCSSDKDATASLNSLGVGRSFTSKGMRISSRFWTIIASFGWNVFGFPRFPINNTKLEYCRARAANRQEGLGTEANLFLTQPCK
mmetsp:Transcript_20027/g.46478  ORF Transcript_20027/g.46478 Transcript_20027/m.46478 type:complete len:210 (+) Transcript_20027:1094-1723(+)